MTTAETWCDRALDGRPVWNIGQLDDETVRSLNKLVRHGDLEKSRLHWANLSPLKTVWHLPGQVPS